MPKGKYALYVCGARSTIYNEIYQGIGGRSVSCSGCSIDGDIKSQSVFTLTVTSDNNKISVTEGMNTGGGGTMMYLIAIYAGE